MAADGISQGDAPTPALADRFALTVTLGPPLTIGRLATGGVRLHRAPQGGTFTGTSGDGVAIDGAVVGGGETLLDRPDGVGVLEANFLVRTKDGGILRLIGTGYRTTDGPFVGTRMTVVFEVDEAGAHAALATRAFVAERADGGDTYVLAEIL